MILATVLRILEARCELLLRVSTAVGASNLIHSDTYEVNKTVGLNKTQAHACPQGVTSPHSFLFLSAMLQPCLWTMRLLRVCSINTVGFVDKLMTKASSVHLEVVI